MPLLTPTASRNRDRRPGPPSPAFLDEYLGRIAAASDDSEEVVSDGNIFLNSADLELGHDDAAGAQIVGLRYELVGITQGSTVNSASIRFTAYAAGSEDVVVRIFCEDADSAAAFSDTTSDLSNRTKTTAFVDWTIPAWTLDQEDADTTTPDLSGPVQEVVNRPGFVAGNGVAFLIEISPTDPGTGSPPTRRAVSYDSGPSSAPQLAINTDHEEDTQAIVTGDYSLLGDEDFDRFSLDNSETDANGLTLRDWYDKLLAGGTAGTFDVDFDSADNRPANRQGAMYVTSMLIGLRMLGDLQLLDECVRLTELWYGNLTTDGDGYLHHNDGTYDQALDVRLASGVFARVMWACEVNKGLTSPAGHDYGAIATKYHSYLVDDYLPRWRGIEGTNSNLTVGIDHDGATFHHSFGASLAVLYYSLQMGGGGGFTTTQWEQEVSDAFDFYFSGDSVCADGHNGRDVLVYKFTCVADSTLSSAGSLIYTTYIRYVISFMIDLWMEGADSRLNATRWERYSHSMADFVIDADSSSNNELARCIGGDNPPDDERCGIPYNHTYRGRVTNTEKRWQDSAYAFLEGFDSRGRIADFGVEMYGEVSSSFADAYPNYPASRIFTNLEFGW